MTKYKLLISSDSKENLERAINKYYYSISYKITEDNKLINPVFNDEKMDNMNNNYRIINKKSRWRFETSL